jgi:glycosyltransferase involved in cell wall biosynthesis
LRDIDRRAAIGRAARETIERHYTWQAKAGELEALMQELSTRATSQAANA